MNMIFFFINLHKSCKRATPEELMMYKMSLCLFKLYNINFNPLEFVGVNFNQILTRLQTDFFLLKNNTFKVGINSVSNRLYLLNNKIPLEWLNLSLNTFKVKCKKLLLPN